MSQALPSECKLSDASWLQDEPNMNLCPLCWFVFSCFVFVFQDERLRKSCNEIESLELLLHDCRSAVSRDVESNFSLCSMSNCVNPKPACLSIEARFQPLVVEEPSRALQVVCGCAAGCCLQGGGAFVYGGRP